MRKGTIISLVLLTCSNAAIFYFKHYNNSPKKPSVLVVQDNGYFRCLVDENKVTRAFETSQPLLVLRISQRNCEECIYSALDEINNFRPQIPQKNCLIVSSFSSKRDYNLFVNQKLEADLPTFNGDEHHFGLQLEKEATDPFFFILFPDGNIRHLFIPKKEDLTRTRLYLKIIRQKYFSD